MIWRRRPQILPTRKARGAFEGVLRLLEKIPLFREAMRPLQEVTESDIPLTLVIPLHPKDIWIAPYALKYALKNVGHPIEEVVVVSEPSAEVDRWVKEEGLRWVNENEVLDYGKEDLRARLPEHAHGRGGWIFQQLLKYSVDSYIDTEAFLILDADTLLLAPRVFKAGETVWMDYSHERNMLYLKSYRELLGQKAGFLVSFVCHHMFGERHILRALKDRIETHTGEPWDQAIIALAGSSMWSGKDKSTRPFNYFSEYETYGNYSQKFYEDVRARYFRNHAAKEYSPAQMTPDEYVATIPAFFQWASFHSYHGYDQPGGPDSAASADEE